MSQNADLPLVNSVEKFQDADLPLVISVESLRMQTCHLSILNQSETRVCEVLPLTYMFMVFCYQYGFVFVPFIYSLKIITPWMEVMLPRQHCLCLLCLNTCRRNEWLPVICFRGRIEDKDLLVEHS